MSLHIYWPSDLISPVLRGIDGGFLVLASEAESRTTYIVLNLIPYNDVEQLLRQHILRRNEREELSVDMGYEDFVVIGTCGVSQVSESSEIGKGLNFEVKNKNVLCNTATIIVFEPPLPSTMQFYSVSPIPIALADSMLSNNERGYSKYLENYETRDISKQEGTLTITIHNLNNCWIRRRQLLKKYPSMGKSWESKSGIQSIWLSTRGLFIYMFEVLYSCVMKPLNTFLLYMIVGIRHIALIIISLINRKPSADLPSLVEMSATAQQIDLRLQQFAYFPIQYIKTTRKLNRRGLDDRSLPIEEYPEYIRLFNTLWLIINDITLGLVVGTTLIENQDVMIEFFEKTIVSKILYSDLSSASVILMNSPGGIKLNNELSAFLSDLFLWIIEFWKTALINPITPYSRHIIYAIAISSTFGATFSIALFLDFLSIITLHVYTFYYASSKIFNWSLNIVISLFYLFLGQKRNVLRNRIDSNDYEIDQLLLGTLLFTVVTFLLPTVLSFYVTFAVTELSILVVLGSFEVCTALLNHFPIFLILLRIKDYKRVPGGVDFVNKDGCLKVLSKPIYFSEMFTPFNNVLHKLKSTYLSKKTIIEIIQGKPLHVQRHKLYKLLYSALPCKQASTKELWTEIQNLQSSTTSVH